MSRRADEEPSMTASSPLKGEGRVGVIGFTIVELLTAIAIIAILTAILFPVVIAAKKKAKEAACISNLRQIGAALQIYRSVNDEKLPERLSFLYPPYVENAKLFVCPLDPKGGQHEGTERLEGTRFLKSGVSYTWVPNWPKAFEWGWWNPWPYRGPGKWRDQTPVVECHWHWATEFKKDWTTDRNKKAGGNAVILTAGGELHFWPGKRRVKDFSPEG